jgi:hypothetical protein
MKLHDVAYDEVVGDGFNLYLILTPKQAVVERQIFSPLPPSIITAPTKHQSSSNIQMKYIPPLALTALPVTHRLPSEHKNL